MTVKNIKISFVNLKRNQSNKFRIIKRQTKFWQLNYKYKFRNPIICSKFDDYNNLLLILSEN